jgi:hypothetical protein
MQFVHLACLEQWQLQADSTLCPTCKTNVILHPCKQWCIRIASIVIIILAPLLSIYMVHTGITTTVLDVDASWYRDPPCTAVQHIAIHCYDLRVGASYCTDWPRPHTFITVLDAISACRSIVDDFDAHSTLCHLGGPDWITVDNQNVSLDRRPCSIVTEFPRDDVERAEWIDGFFTCIRHEAEIPAVPFGWARRGAWRNTEGLFCQDTYTRYEWFVNGSLCKKSVRRAAAL